MDMLFLQKEQVKLIPFFPNQKAERIKNIKEKACSGGSMGSGKKKRCWKGGSKAFSLVIIGLKQTMIHPGLNGKSTNSCAACTSTGCLTSNSGELESSDGTRWNNVKFFSLSSSSIQYVPVHQLLLCVLSML